MPRGKDPDQDVRTLNLSRRLGVSRRRNEELRRGKLLKADIRFDQTNEDERLLWRVKHRLRKEVKRTRAYR